MRSMRTPEGGSSYRARGHQGGAELFLLITFYVNTPTGAVVTKRVPINTNLSRRPLPARPSSRVRAQPPSAGRRWRGALLVAAACSHFTPGPPAPRVPSSPSPLPCDRSWNGTKDRRHCRPWAQHGWRTTARGVSRLARNVRESDATCASSEATFCCRCPFSERQRLSSRARQAGRASQARFKTVYSEFQPLFITQYYKAACPSPSAPRPASRPRPPVPPRRTAAPTPASCAGRHARNA